ncbi:HipA domain-containing protein [Echinicola soli]|uniref:HipA domain-containing protein n=1 Tax=Echinicola soli TaxID=2591634 RepID=A0A514CDI2_9BACT|nr:HipA domain-containing protein [Echinicola soli]QDH77873.1 HipA domain-containing protein [Echinicola soli]
MIKITNCPGTLAPDHETYSTRCIRHMFEGKKTSHFLPYQSHQSNNDQEMAALMDNRKRISISGVQEKLSVIWDKGVIRLTKAGEQGTYILKPIPRDLERVGQVPANEHLTMQIAKQVYGLTTAENALIFFQNGEPAYLTKRFDVLKNGKKLGIEDFATLAGKTKETDGDEFKYNYSYEGIADLIKQYATAAPIVLENFYKLVLFNFLFSNGDAHLKNFSLLETPAGDYQLSPAYDLTNSQLHVKDPELALKDGLFKNDYETESYKANAFYAYDDFYEFGIRIGLLESRTSKILSNYIAEQTEVKTLIYRSFLNEEAQKIYMQTYQQRLRSLNYSFNTKL